MDERVKKKRGRPGNPNPKGGTPPIRVAQTPEESRHTQRQKALRAARKAVREGNAAKASLKFLDYLLSTLMQNPDGDKKVNPNNIATLLKLYIESTKKVDSPETSLEDIAKILKEGKDDS